jgi:diguanylate cyclase (GGDEF)-like protein/PAS domain S-box-containing protein
MYNLWQGLLANFAVVAMVILAWANSRDLFKRFGFVGESIAMGLVMGAGSLLAMSLAFPLLPGFICDLRTAPIAIAGLFGGPIAAILAAGPALAYRAWLGGAGAPAGCFSIIAFAIFATFYNRRIAAHSISKEEIVAAATIVATAGTMGGWLITPFVILKATLVGAALPLLVLNIVGISIAAIALFHDQQRRELIADNALFKAVIEALPEPLNVKDLDGRFIAANPATARLMNAKSVDDLLGKTDFDFYPEATAQRFDSDEKSVLRRGQAETIIQQKIDPGNGRTSYLSTLKAPFRDEEGRIIGLISHNRDITTSKVLESELERTRRQLTDALENMADGLVAYSSDHKIILCNKRYRDLFPLTADVRVVGARFENILRQAIARGEESLPLGLDEDAFVERILEQTKTGGVREFKMADGRWIEARTRPTADGGFLAVLSDVTMRKLAERQLHFKAEHDAMTGLANRASFEKALSQMFVRARERQTEVGVLIVDLDNFKQVNDKFGHQAGDLLLVEVAKRLQAACRQGDLVARIGGDEFAIVSEGLSLGVGLPRLAQRLVDNVSAVFRFEQITFLPGCSVGVAVFPRDASDADKLLARADEALYAAKRAGRRRWAVCDGDRVILQAAS